MAKFNYRYSAMNAGKTGSLLDAAHQYERSGLGIAIAKPGVDSKGGNKVISRKGPERKVDALFGPEDSVVEVLDPIFAVKAVKCVLVDEAQFLSPNQVDELYWEVSCDLDTSVIAYGLRADFLAQPFPGSERLMTLADDIREIITMCRCGSQASMNARYVDGEMVFEGEQVAIDGEGYTYDSLCKKCYRTEFLAFQAAKGLASQHVTSAL